MRRRAPKAAAVEMPEQLQRYAAADWAHLVGPEPDWWGQSPGLTCSWAGFKARRLWGKARQAWLTAAGVTWWGRTSEGRARAVRELRQVGIEFNTKARAN